MSLKVALTFFLLAVFICAPLRADGPQLESPTVPPTGTPTETPTQPPATSTPTRSQPPSYTPTITRTPTPTATRTRTPYQGGCRGDYNGDGDTTVDELITMVSIAISGCFIPQCQGDFDGSGDVTVDEILIAVSEVLGGCPDYHTPTPASTETQTPIKSRAPTSPPTPTATPTPGVNRLLGRWLITSEAFSESLAFADLDPASDPPSVIGQNEYGLGAVGIATPGDLYSYMVLSRSARECHVYLFDLSERGRMIGGVFVNSTSGPGCSSRTIAGPYYFIGDRL